MKHLEGYLPPLRSMQQRAGMKYAKILLFRTQTKIYIKNVQRETSVTF